MKLDFLCSPSKVIPQANRLTPQKKTKASADATAGKENVNKVCLRREHIFAFVVIVVLWTNYDRGTPTRIPTKFPPKIQDP